MTRSRFLLLQSLGLLLSSSSAARPQLAPEHLSQLEQGKVISFSEDVSNSSIDMGKAIGLIPDVPEAVAYVLLDVGKYKHFLPRVKDSRVTKYRKGDTYAVVETDLPWPFKDSWAYIKFHRQDKPGRTFAVSFHMLNGTMESYSGEALIEPWSADATKSVLTYKFLAVPKITAPDSTVSDGLKQVATTVVQRIKLRLKALRKFNKMPKGF